MHTDDIEALAAALEAATDAVVFTGAGVSTASGVPDFRGESGPGPDESVWDRHDLMDFHRRRFDADPAGFWEDRVALRETMGAGDVEPNAAHEAIAALEAAGVVDTVVTQNVDGLHRAAGSDPVLLHGTNDRAVCDDCGRTIDAEAAVARVRDGEVPPTCEGCGGVLKPDVVLFGEELPGERLDRAQSRARECDCFLAVGSSLRVRPASLLPRVAADAGATLAVVNLESTPVDDVADHTLAADVTDVMPELAERLAGEAFRS